jgi:hypothetical protein
MATPGVLDLTKQHGTQATSTIATGSTGAPFWGNAPRSWQKVRLGGLELPGTASVTGSVRQRYDKKKVPGKGGATYTVLGTEPGKVEIVLTLWTDEQFEDYQRLVPLFRPPKTKTKRKAGTPLTIEHPNCTLYNIKAVVVMEAGMAEDAGEPGVKRVKLSCEEFMSDGKRKGKVVTEKAPLTIESRGPGAIQRQLQEQSKPSAAPPAGPSASFERNFSAPYSGG